MPLHTEAERKKRGVGTPMKGKGMSMNGAKAAISRRLTNKRKNLATSGSTY